ncbi:MAG TPA: hypothetical protein VL307_13425 [Chitinophagaceae bacterium]|nr:hypothetical protein [Chitinophagaceae bacterium]
MKKNLIMASLVLAFVTVSTAGFSQTTPVVKERQENQQKRIAGGVKSGELTAAETKRLEAREVKIQHDKREAKADGVVTTKERVKLHREQNRASRAIYRQKHDAQTRH